MKSDRSGILTINGGSSSIKFSLYATDSSFQPLLQGKIERIGTSHAGFSYKTLSEKHEVSRELKALTMDAAVVFLLDWLDKEVGFDKIIAVGHRIVHGMRHNHAEFIDRPLLEELKKISAFDPEHMPFEIALIEKIMEKHSDLKQIACFDTAFHADLPRVASMFPIPRKLEKEGIRRYGFHGLSYGYLLDKLKETGGENLVNGRLILAHLGSGCSMAAVRNGKSVDTTMGFTPTGGLMMGTRCGDIDPGIIGFLLQNDKLTSKDFIDLINHQSGLLGVSETSPDMHDLLQSAATDVRAAEAVNLFCYQAKKWIGAFTTVLEGLDTLVFTGGIGENEPEIRARICLGLEYMGIKLDEKRNGKSESIISADDSRINVYVIPANEEFMIARLTAQLLGE